MPGLTPQGDNRMSTQPAFPDCPYWFPHQSVPTEVDQTHKALSPYINTSGESFSRELGNSSPSEGPQALCFNPSTASAKSGPGKRLCSKPLEADGAKRQSPAGDSIAAEQGIGAWKHQMGPVSAALLSILPPDEADAAGQVKTGDDVMQFYAKYGQGSAVRYFYCNRVHSKVLFGPYDLLVVPREDVDPQEHFTMSASGVLLIRKGAESEFIPLGQWFREKSLFSLLSCLPFFKHYIIARAFKRWHKRVRHVLFKRVRATVASRLFWAKPLFCRALLDVGIQLADLAAVRNATTGVAGGHLYQLDEYSDLQVAQREQTTRPAIEAVVERTQQVLFQHPVSSS
eukprot:jgi/Botrbrau1/8166/Bobra.357_2s0012.1